MPNGPIDPGPRDPTPDPSVRRHGPRATPRPRAGAARRLLLRLAAGVAAGVVATALTVAFQGFLSTNLFLVFLVATLITALYAGVWAGLATVAIAVVGLGLFLLPPVGAFPETGADLLRLLFYAAGGITISVLSEALRKAQRSAREREASLGESEASYRGLFDNINEPIFLIDPGTRRFIEANSAAGALLRMPPASIRGLSPVDISPPEDRDLILSIMGRIDQALAGRPQRFEWRALRGDGETLPAEVSLSATHYFGRDVVLAAVHDLSATRRLEEQLRHAQKMEAVGRLAGGVAHDFNNVLTAIRGHADLAAGHLPADHPAAVDVAEIERAAELASSITGQLLTMSRARVVEPRPVPVDHHVTGLERMLRRLLSAEMELITDTAAPDAWIVIDPGQLEQVVLNLVVNARDAMSQGGRVTIRTWRDSRNGGNGRAPAADDGRGDVVLEVADEGSGLDPSIRDRIFEPFFTTKPHGRGTGLGLSMVDSIVRGAGGRIDVRSAPGAGTAFTLRFPRAAAPATSPAAASQPLISTSDPTTGGGRTVLVVEDEDAIRRLMEKVLVRAGYRVLTAPDGPRGLEEWEGADRRVDLLLTDMVIPGLTGAELAARMRTGVPELRILFTSGFSPEDLNGARSAMRDAGFIQKPFTPGALVAAVREALGAEATAGRG